MQSTSETPGSDEFLRLLMVGEHLPIETVTRGAMGRIGACVRRQFAGRGADDGAPSITDGNVEAEIGAVHRHPPPTDAVAANGSTSLWIGCARPIQGSGRMQRAQSAKLGMKPRSSNTCCSPIRRTGTTRPVEMVTVAPK